MKKKIINNLVNLINKEENKNDLKVILTPIVEVIFNKINPIFYYILLIFIINFILLLATFVLTLQSKYSTK